MKRQIISLYDYTGEALRPWAEAGFECYAYDIQHTRDTPTDFIGAGYIVYSHADLFDPDGTCELLRIVARPCGFHVCLPAVH